MSNWELIDYDRFTGMRKYIGDHPDDPDGVLIAYDQDKSAIQQILDRNKAGQAEGRSRPGDNGEGRGDSNHRHVRMAHQVWCGTLESQSSRRGKAAAEQQ